MPHENQNSPVTSPVSTPQKEKKYIRLQGFVEVDKDNNIHFLTGSGTGSSLTVSAVSQELFQTTVGGKTAWFANVLIPYSEESSKALKAFGKGGYRDDSPGVVVVFNPPVGGPKHTPTGEISWKVVIG